MCTLPLNTHPPCTLKVCSTKDESYNSENTGRLQFSCDLVIAMTTAFIQAQLIWSEHIGRFSCLYLCITIKIVIYSNVQVAGGSSKYCKCEDWVYTHTVRSSLPQKFVYIHELGSRNHDIGCVQVALVDARWRRNLGAKFLTLLQEDEHNAHRAFCFLCF